jgi:hypothetical protein
MSWNINKPGDYINGPLTVMGVAQFNSNVGVGVTPSAGSTYKVIQGGGGIVFGSQGTQSNFTENAYLAGAGTWTYATNAAASLYQQTGGTHTWYRTSAGTGNIAWTQAMTLDASSRLIVGGGSAYGRSTFTVGTGLQGGTTTNVGSALYDIDYAASGDINTRLSFVNSNGVTNAAIDRIGNPYFSDTGHLAFLTRASGGSLSERARFNATGAFVLAGGATAANGVGITFPAAQSASTDANTLDDYEEGTWTPTISAGSGTPTTVTINSAGYTKIGRQVTLHLDFSIIDKGTANGVFLFSLPFTSSASFAPAGSFKESSVVGYMGPIYYVSTAYAGLVFYNDTVIWTNNYRVRGTYTYTV